MIAGTEKLTGAIISRWKSGGRRFFNAYGPTEATIYQLIWEAPDGPPPDNPPIGTPTPGVQVYLLDDDLKPVDEGATGELCLAGTCLGSGYINRPELTREKFTTAPLGPNGEAIRIYRTGDRAKRLPDGTYEYHGRLDLQVKVRGFRVEPGEIETTLTQHAAVDSSAVVAAPDGSGQMRLWAYFIPRGASVPTTKELKAFLAARLPEYMVPSGFTVMTHWPLNANGKLDRSQLAVPGQDEAPQRDRYAAAVGVRGAVARAVPRDPRQRRARTGRFPAGCRLHLLGLRAAGLEHPRRIRRGADLHGPVRALERRRARVVAGRERRHPRRPSIA